MTDIKGIDLGTDSLDRAEAMNRLGRDVAAALGTTWHAVERTDDISSNRVKLACPPCGKEFGLTIRYDKRDMRFHVYPTWPHAETDRTEFPHYSQRPDLDISITVKKDPYQIARDIRRRFLPEYVAAYNKAVAQAEAHDAWMQTKRSTAETVAAAAGGSVRDGDGSTVDTRMGKQSYIRTIQVNSDTVEIDFRNVPADLAVKLLTLWREYEFGN